MVTFTDSDDRRSSYLRNKAIQNANAVRERRATVENPQWAMSRPADWYQDRGNLASIKDTLVNQQGNRDFWTTDQGESRNAYQMLMNQMKGGDRGARMMDLRGLPAATQADPNRYRRGRTMFQDPSKAQGFLGDVGSLFTGKNRAAVYADEYNPFPKAGFGKDWYKDQFPIASGLDSLMGLAEKSPTLNMLAGLFPKKERVPLDRDLSWVPEGMGEYDEIPEIPFIEDVVGETPLEAVDRTDDWWYTPPFFDEDITVTDLPPETFEEPTNEIFNEEVFNKVYELIHPTGQTAAEMPEHFDLYKTPWNMFQMMKESMEEGEWNDQELLDLLVERGYLKDTTGGEDLDPSKYPSQLRLEDKVKSMSLEEMEKLLEDQETWEGDRIDI